MEFHIGISVTVLTSDYDSPDGSPTREIAMVLLVGILCIELAGWNKLVVKVQVNMTAHLYKPPFSVSSVKVGIQLFSVLKLYDLPEVSLL